MGFAAEKKLRVSFRREQYEVEGGSGLTLLRIMLCHEGSEASGRDSDVYMRRPSIIGFRIVALEPERTFSV